MHVSIDVLTHTHTHTQHAEADRVQRGAAAEEARRALAARTREVEALKEVNKREGKEGHTHKIRE